MISASQRGAIAGSQEALNYQWSYLQNHKIKRLAHQIFSTMQKDGYAHIEPESDFVTSFYNSFKLTLLAMNEVRNESVEVASYPEIVPTPMGDKAYYVYTLSYPDGFVDEEGVDLSGVVFYVGRGKVAEDPAKQRVDYHEREAKAKRGTYATSGISFKCEVIRRIWGKGMQVQKRVVFQTNARLESLDYEKECFARYRSAYLVNALQ